MRIRDVWVCVLATRLVVVSPFCSPRLRVLRSAFSRDPRVRRSRGFLFAPPPSPADLRRRGLLVSFAFVFARFFAGVFRTLSSTQRNRQRTRVTKGADGVTHNAYTSVTRRFKHLALPPSTCGEEG